MNKADMIAHISEETGINKALVNDMLDSFTGAITQALKKGEKVMLVDFGTFSISHRSARVGRNPKSGEQVMIPEKKVPHFKPGKELRERVDYKAASDSSIA